MAIQTSIKSDSSANQFEVISGLIQQGEWTEALSTAKKSIPESDTKGQKIRAFLLLANQKYPEADSLCSKLLGREMDHELLVWRGIARSELGLWYSALKDLSLAHEFFPQQSTEQRIDFTTQRACKSISEGMRLDGGTFNDFFERARIYVMNQDSNRGARDIASAEKLNSDSADLKKLRATISYLDGKLPEALENIDLYLDAEPDDLDAIILKAKIKASTGRLRASLALLRNAARDLQDDEIAQLKLAKCRCDIRDFHGAIKDFSLILSRQPSAATAYFGRGKALLEIRKFDDAVADFAKAIELGGQNASILTLLGEAKLATGLKKEASTAFKDAMKFEPDHWPAKLGYAKVKNMRKQSSEAISIASDLAKQHPDHEIRLFLGSVYFDEKDFVSAVEHFTKALERCQTHFDSASCLYRRGSARLENNEPAAAIIDFDRALELRPYHVGTLVWRGYAHGKLGRWADAITDLQSAIDMNPMAAEQYKKLGDYIAEHALQHFGEAIRNNQADDQAFFNRGMAYQFLGQRDSAYADFEQALKLNPNHGDAQVRLGTLFLKDNQSKKAYNLFSDAVKSKPSVTALLMRADAMLQLGVIQPALLDIREAIRTSRDNDRLFVRRGELYAARDLHEKALDDFTLSIALNFDNFQAFKERGQLFVKRELFDEAVRDYSLSLHFYYRQPGLMIERGNLLLRLGRYDEAAHDFEQALALETGSESVQELDHDALITAYIGRAKAIQNLDRSPEALTWLTKAIHRFDQPEEWARIVKARGEIFLKMGRFERASADARIASKLNPDPKFSADCYYLRALCSYYHRDRDHAIKTLEKAYTLDENHARVELALDWFKEMAEAPPEEWHHTPKKIRPTRPKADGETPQPIELAESELHVDPPMDLWLVKKDDQEFGPIPFKTLAEWAAEGRINEETRLFRTDWGKWKSVQKLTTRPKT